MKFHPTIKGSNIELQDDGLLAVREQSYDDSVVFSHAPIAVVEGRRTVEFVIRRYNSSRWNGSLKCGIISTRISKLDLSADPRSYKACWILDDTTLSVNGKRVKRDYKDMDELREEDSVKVVLESDGTLHYFFNDEDQGEAAANIPTEYDYYAVADVYGQTYSLQIKGEVMKMERLAFICIGIISNVHRAGKLHTTTREAKACHAAKGDAVQHQPQRGQHSISWKWQNCKAHFIVTRSLVRLQRCSDCQS
jgi:hypothetical protein